MTRLHELFEVGGQSPWLDNLKRSYLTSGHLAELVAQGVRGLTSNPTIMAKAIAGSADYDEEFSTALSSGATVEEAYWDLVIDDVEGRSRGAEGGVRRERRRRRLRVDRGLAASRPRHRRHDRVRS